MRSRIRIGLLAILLCLSGHVLAKSWSVASIHSAVQVRTDASVRVTETLTYNFQGSYTFAFRDIPLKPGESIFDVSVGESGRDYVEGSNELPGTFQVSGANPVRITGCVAAGVDRCSRVVPFLPPIRESAQSFLLRGGR